MNGPPHLVTIVQDGFVGERGGAEGRARCDQPVRGNEAHERRQLAAATSPRVILHGIVPLLTHVSSTKASLKQLIRSTVSANNFPAAGQNRGSTKDC